MRALYAAYSGPLYQVRKTADGTTMDVTVLEPGGFANSVEQETFCGTAGCTISIIYDQSPQANHLTKSPAGMAKTTPGNEANAKALPATFAGHKVYGVNIVPGVGYRNNAATGTAEGDDPDRLHLAVSMSWPGSSCATAADLAELIRRELEVASGHRSRAV